MNNIDQRIKQLKSNKELGLIAHAVLGYPTMEKSLEIIKTLISAGSNFLELQIPFSDPVVDGVPIMEACEVALKNGMNTDKAFEIIDRLGSATKVPILLMAYYNTVFRYGIEKFCKKAQNLGVSGLIVPDIPPEEESTEKFISTCFKYDLYPIRVVSPSSSIDRLKINSKFARGFVYCVSHFGVTGSNVEINDDFRDYIRNAKRVIKLPVAVGFGLSETEQMERLKGIANIAIVGSAIVNNYDTGGIKKLSLFIKTLKESTIL